LTLTVILSVKLLVVLDLLPILSLEGFDRLTQLLAAEKHDINRVSECSAVLE
jgi:hypothetical protein